MQIDRRTLLTSAAASTVMFAMPSATAGTAPAVTAPLAVSGTNWITFVAGRDPLSIRRRMLRHILNLHHTGEHARWLVDGGVDLASSMSSEMPLADVDRRDRRIRGWDGLWGGYRQDPDIIVVEDYHPANDYLGEHLPGFGSRKIWDAAMSGHAALAGIVANDRAQAVGTILEGVEPWKLNDASVGLLMEFDGEEIRLDSLDV